METYPLVGEVDFMPEFAIPTPSEEWFQGVLIGLRQREHP
jgi:hypothetical protein